MEGPGSGAGDISGKPKNIRILRFRIWILNTVTLLKTFHAQETEYPAKNIDFKRYENIIL
jgi:hypothetical protein